MNTTATRRHHRRLAALLGGLAATAVLAAPATAYADTTPTAPADADATTSVLTPEEQVVATVQPGVVYEEITYSAWVWSDYNEEDIRNRPFSVTFQCTGAVVNPDGWIATAGHCVSQKEGLAAVRQAAIEWALANYYVASADHDSADADLDVYTWDGENVHDDRVTRRVEVTLPPAVTGDDTVTRPARVIASTEFAKGDAALLKVEASDLYALPLAEEEVSISTDVVTVGYPAIVDSFTDKDLTPTFNSGQVSSTKTIGGGLLDVYQLSAAMSGGMSGGPTVNLDGEVVGINSAGFDGEQINYAMPIDRIRELMAGAGVENEVGETTTALRDGVAALADGDKATAVELLRSVTEAQPTNEAAAELLDEALALPDPVAPAAPAAAGSGSSLVLVLALGGVALLLAGAGIVTALVRAARRRRTATQGGVTASAAYPVPPAAPVAPATPGFGYPAPVPAFTGAPSPYGSEPTVVPAAPSSPPARPAFGFDPSASSACSSCGGSRSGGWPMCGCRH